MSVDPALVQAFIDLLRPAQRVLVVSHIRPDGDAIGSLIGLGLALQSLGKEVQFISEDGVPASLHHLEGRTQVMGRPKAPVDLICVVDCSDLERTGSTLQGLGQPQINIDHHRTNLNFAQVNIVDPQAVATAEIIAALLPQLGVSISPAIGAALLTGLITDTIGFRTSNMTPAALRLAADLMELGLDLPDLYRRALVNRSYEAVRLWGQGLARLEREGRLIYTSLTHEDRRAVGYGGKDDADLINLLNAITGVDIAVVFVEQPNEHVKVSWRAVPGYDVSQIALRFGGGGHPAAAGADISGTLPQIQHTILEATRPLLNGGANVQ